MEGRNGRVSRIEGSPGCQASSGGGLIAGLLVLGVRPALAQSSEQDQAREHYKKGLAAYNLGQYSEAASEFEAAYRLFLDPALLFNIAQAHRMNGELEKALNGYRSYLRTAAPGTPRPRAGGEVAAGARARGGQDQSGPFGGDDCTGTGEQAARTRVGGRRRTATEPEPEPRQQRRRRRHPRPPPRRPRPRSRLPRPNPGAPAAMPTLEATSAPTRTADSNESSHWWIWGVAGGAVVAGVIAALLLTRSHSLAPDCVEIMPCGTLH